MSRGSILKDTEMSVLMLTHCVNLSILFHKQKAMAIFLKGYYFFGFYLVITYQPVATT